MSADIYFCFCCLSNNDLSNLFSCDSENNHAAMLELICSVYTSRQEFEHNSYICRDCIDKLQDAVKFKHLVQETLTVLERNGLVQISHVEDKILVHNVSVDVKSSDENEYKMDEDTLMELKDPLALEKPKIKRIKVENKTVQVKFESENSPTNPPVIKVVKIPIGAEPIKMNYTLFKEKKENSSAVKPYPCEFCEIRFSSIAAVKRHMGSHTGKRPYQCTICTKKFRLNGDLKNHIRIHTGEKPYKCNVCGKSYSQSTHLNTHMRVHTGERPYECNFCYKTFATNYIKTHILSCTGQKPHQCNICGKGFASTSHLGLHKKYHKGERPYQCKFCGKGFVRSHYLAVHMRIHTGEKPYPCDICKKRFALKQALKRHVVSCKHKRGNSYHKL